MVVAVWLAESMTITSIARAAAIRFQQQPRTLYEAFDRALGSVAIDPMKIDRSHARRVLQGRRVVRVAIDWLSLRNDSMRVLLAAVCDDQGRKWRTRYVRRCGGIARDRGLARQFSTSGRRPRSHSTVSLGLFHAEASTSRRPGHSPGRRDQAA
jgi:hypothetical protein